VATGAVKNPENEWADNGTMDLNPVRVTLSRPAAREATENGTKRRVIEDCAPATVLLTFTKTLVSEGANAVTEVSVVESRMEAAESMVTEDTICTDGCD